MFGCSADVLAVACGRDKLKKDYRQCVISKLRRVLDDVNWEAAGAWTCPNDAVRGLQPLLPVLAELLLMQCAYFVVPNSHGAATLLDSPTLRNDLGSRFRACHRYQMCYRPEKDKPRHLCNIAVDMRAKEGGAGASITLKVDYDQEHVQRCRCKECYNLDYALPSNRSWKFAELAKGKRAVEAKEEKEGNQEQSKRRRSPRLAGGSYLK